VCAAKECNKVGLFGALLVEALFNEIDQRQEMSIRGGDAVGHHAISVYGVVRGDVAVGDDLDGLVNFASECEVVDWLSLDAV
jgi:hypothetical protein